MSEPKKTFTAPDGTQVEYTAEALANIESGVCPVSNGFRRACPHCIRDVAAFFATGQSPRAG